MLSKLGRKRISITVGKRIYPRDLDLPIISESTKDSMEPSGRGHSHCYTVVDVSPYAPEEPPKKE